MPRALWKPYGGGAVSSERGTTVEDSREFQRVLENGGATVERRRDESCTDRYSSQFENNYFTEMCSGSEAGSYLRLIDLCITQL